MKRLALLSAALLSLSAIAAHGHGLKCTLSDEKPVKRVAVSHDAGDDAGNSTFFKRGTGGYREIGQAFKLDKRDAEITGVTFRVLDADPQVLGKKIAVKVYELKAVNEAPADPQATLAVAEGNLPATIEPLQYLTFSFAEPIPLQQNRCYLVLLSFQEPTSNDGKARSLSLERSNNKAGFGRLWTYNGDAFVADAKAMTFFVHTK